MGRPAIIFYENINFIAFFAVMFSFDGNVSEGVSQNKSTRLLTKASEGTIHSSE
jgi:hypothetical protein